MFPGFDGLMTLSRREGVDIRPTLLRVLTDLYVQTPSHTDDEERQFVELASRLIDQVDDATRAAVRARLSIYPRTPRPILEKLVLRRPSPGQRIPLARSIKPAELPVVAPPKPPSEAELRMAPTLSMQPNDASEISAMFFVASSSERIILIQADSLRRSVRWLVERFRSPSGMRMYGSCESPPSISSEPVLNPRLCGVLGALAPSISSTGRSSYPAGASYHCTVAVPL